MFQKHFRKKAFQGIIQKKAMFQDQKKLWKDQLVRKIWITRKNRLLKKNLRKNNSKVE